MILYRQAAEANKSSDDKLVYLIELDVVVSFRSTADHLRQAIPPQRT
jgi:hypothetical protein